MTDLALQYLSPEQQEIMHRSLRRSASLVAKGTAMITLQQLHDAEIPGSISWLFDGAWEVTIGLPVKGRERELVRTEAEALEWLKTKAREIYGWEPK